MHHVHHWFTYPDISPIAFRIGPLAVHWYGIAYLVGFVCVYLWMSRPEGRARLGLTAEQIQDFMVYALVGVLVGGRTLFVIADWITHHDQAEYFAHPIRFIAVWQGGMAFHGGLIGVIIAMVLFLRKHPGLTYTVLADEIVPLLPIGIGLTRIVNFINDELWGRVCSPDNPICIKFPLAPDHGTLYRYPSQLFESALDFATLPILLWLYRRKPNDGVLGWTWFMLYGITRTIAEFYRKPGFVVFGLTGGQLLAVPMIFIGAVMVYRCARTGTHTVRVPQAEQTASGSTA